MNETGKILRVAFADIGNMGDQLNRLIIGRLLRLEVVPAGVKDAEVLGIGSHLSQLAESDPERHPPIVVWGTGFISRRSSGARLPGKDVDYRAVRGELSRRILEKKLGRPLDIPTGDPGLLTSLLFDEPIPKRHKLAVIPHFRERDDARFQELARLTDDSVVIDLTGDPLTVIRQIAECECVISSSLHGLIVADSFGIPSLHVHVTDRVNGDGFKFDDYYSAFDVEHRAVDLNTTKITDVGMVRDRYAITPEAVREKQQQLLAAFRRGEENQGK